MHEQNPKNPKTAAAQLNSLRRRRRIGAALFVGGLLVSGASLFHPASPSQTFTLTNATTGGTSGSSGSSGSSGASSSGASSSGASGGASSSGASGGASS